MNNNEPIIMEEEKGDIFDELIGLLEQSDDEGDEGEDLHDILDESENENENDMSYNETNTDTDKKLEYNLEQLLHMNNNISNENENVVNLDIHLNTIINNKDHTQKSNNNINVMDVSGNNVNKEILHVDSSNNNVSKKRKKNNNFYKYKKYQYQYQNANKNKNNDNITKIDYRHKPFKLNPEKQKLNKEMRSHIRSDINDICQQKYKQTCLDTILKDERVIQKLNMTFENNIVKDLFNDLHQLMENKKEEYRETKMLSKYSSKYMFDIFYIVSHHIMLDKEKAKEIISKNPDILINFLEYKNMRRLRLNKKKKITTKSMPQNIQKSKLYNWNTKTFSEVNEMKIE